MSNIEKKVLYSKYLSLYGNLLTPYQQEIFTLYNDNDVSLTEIGEQYNITRQGVREIIKKVINKLSDYENKLNFTAFSEDITRDLYKLREVMSERDDKEIINKISDIINKMED